MAMLAERRERKRYNLVPRGKALYEDEHRFGTRMLEKMGWSKGKGLGASESGTQEFIRIRYKNDSVGLGFEDRNDQWTQHEASFDGLLKSLNSSIGCNSSNSNFEQEPEQPATVGFGCDKQAAELPTVCISGESLEEKSKQSRARVHYMKFTRGKDISRYSEKDLANIFGKKSLQMENKSDLPEVEQPPMNNESSKKTSDNEEEKEHTFGVTTIKSGTSIQDYFKVKMEALRNKSKKLNNYNNVDNTDDHQTEKENKNDECNTDERATKEKKSKLKHRKRHLNDENHVEKDIPKIVYANEEDNKARKKKKLSKDDLEYDARSLDDSLSQESQMTLEASTNMVQKEKTSEKKKRKKSKHLHDEISDNSESLVKNIEPEFLENGTENSCKNKKSKRKGSCQEDSIMTELDVNSQAAENNLATTEKKLKQKNKTDQDACENESPLLDSGIEQLVKKRKNKIKSAQVDDSIEIIQYEDSDRNIHSEANRTEKRKKKSKKPEIVEDPNEMNTEEPPNKNDRKNKHSETKTNAEISERVNTNVTDSMECSVTGKVKKSKKRNGIHKEKEDSSPPHCDNSSSVLFANCSSPIQQVSTALSQAATSDQSPFRFPELKPKRRKTRFNQKTCNKENSIEVNAKTGEENNDKEEEDEEGCKYKVTGVSAEKFYNVDINGFVGSNLEDILGYGLNGRIKIEIQRKNGDALAIKNYYKNELLKEEASRKKCNIRMLVRKKQRSKTCFPEKLV